MENVHETRSIQYPVETAERSANSGPRRFKITIKKGNHLFEFIFIHFNMIYFVK